MTEESQAAVTSVGPDGLVQLRFLGRDGELTDLNAHELSEVLQGMVEFASDMAKVGTFGDGPPPEVRVRPAQEGSFIVDFIMQWAEPYGIAMSAGAGLTQAFNLATRRMREEPTDVDYLPNGNVKVQYDRAVFEVPEQAWKELNKQKRRTRGALRKIMAPLGDDAEQLEMRDGAPTDTTEEVLQSPPDVVVDRTDYREAATEVDDVEEATETFETEAQLRSVDFKPGEKWRFTTTRGTRRATMDDSEFLAQLDKGMALHKGDIFDLTIREERTIRNGRTVRDWTILKAARKRRGGDDDDDHSTPDPEASGD